MVDFTNDDFLAALREAQDAQKGRGPGSFGEWAQEQDLHKAPRGGGRQSSLAHMSPGFGLMGQYTNSRAPTGPNMRPNGNPAVGRKDKSWFGSTPGMQFGANIGSGSPNGPRPSKYDFMRPDQPPPWIDDVNMESVWYSPMEPVWPFGPPYYNVPREWDFPVGYNLNFVPQRLNLVGTLRGMRQSWGVLSTIIETRKDQLLRLPWTIQVKGKPRASSKAADQMRAFFRRPDGILSYSQWTRKLLDDLFCVDAPSVFIERDLGGTVRQAQVLDGGTIFPLIDDTGRRPDTTYRQDASGIVYEHRQPAFQQIIKGLPMVNLSADELMYPMMRPRPDLPVFGYSQIEQILTETTEAIRKTFYQLEFWRAGSMPELIVTVPDNWTPRQIASFQGHFDALLSGQLTLKSKVRFVPGGMKPFDIKNASGESLWSQRDELLVRLCCYAFSVSPTPFVHQTNRATANQSQETAEEEGLYPLMSWWKDDIMDTIIQEKCGFGDIEFVFLPRAEPDQVKQSQIHQVQLHDGVITINEARSSMGLEPIEDGDAHLVYSGNNVMRLDQILDGTALQPGQPSPEGPPQKSKPSGENQPARRGAAAPTGTPRPRSNVSRLPDQPATKPSSVHKTLTAKDIADAAAQTNPHPDKMQRKLGNFKKGKFSYKGLPITIENAKGSRREEKDRFGIKQGVKMPAAYGYIRRTLGADGMQVDCYVGKHPASDRVWVVDQDKFDADGVDKGFDEHKVFLAYPSAEKVIKHYLESHYDGLGYERLCAVTEVTISELKKWLKKGDMHAPISEQQVGRVVARRGDGGLLKSDTISQSTGLLNYDLSNPSGKRRRRKRKRSASGPRWLTLVA